MIRNQRSVMVLVAAVLLLTGTASADLVVRDYLGNGQLVVEDTRLGGNHWYSNLADFVDKTYEEQLAQIAGLNTTSPPYGNLAGGWHLATHDEMAMLFSHTPLEDITTAFGYSVLDGMYPYWSGRAEHTWIHASTARYAPELKFYADWTLVASLHDQAFWNADRVYSLGAWVTTSAAVVPAPGALILAATGLLSSTLVLNRRRRKS